MLVQLEAVAVELHLVDPRGGVKRRGGPARQSRRWNCQLKFSRNSRVYTLLSRNPPGTHRPPVPLVTAAVSASIHTVRVRFANLPATSLPTPVEYAFFSPPIGVGPFAGRSAARFPIQRWVTVVCSTAPALPPATRSAL